MAQDDLARRGALRSTDQFMSGRRSSQRTPVSRSISGQNSAGTLSLFHRETEAFDTPRAEANLLEPSNLSQAAWSGDVDEVSIVSDYFTAQYRIPKQRNRHIVSLPYAFCMGFGERLKDARKSFGLTGDKLGEKLGVSKQTVSHWEAERYEPNIHQLIKLSELLEVSCDWLITGRSAEAMSPAAMRQAKFYDSLSPDEQRRFETMKMLMMPGASDATIERRMPVTKSPAFKYPKKNTEAPHVKTAIKETHGRKKES
jgi:transcriptional regulator with XRE-family HTH domain